MKGKVSSGPGGRIATAVNRSLVRNDREFYMGAVGRADVGIGPYEIPCRGGRPCPPAPDNATPCRAGPVCPAVGAEKIRVGPSRTPAPTDGLQEGAVCRADVGIGPYGSVTRGAGKESPSHGFAVPAPFRQGGQGRGGLYGATKIFLFSCKFILEKQLGICYTLHYSGNKFLST